MKRLDHLKILNLDETATQKDIKDAYIHLISLYKNENIITEPLDNEFFKENREKIIKDIESAYEYLKTESNEKNNKNIKTENIEFEEKPENEIHHFNGTALKRIRESKRVNLEEIAIITNIKRQYLINIENEEFDDLPPKVFIKGYLKELCRYLCIDDEIVIPSYMINYEHWITNKK